MGLGDLFRTFLGFPNREEIYRYVFHVISENAKDYWINIPT